MTMMCSALLSFFSASCSDLRKPWPLYECVLRSSAGEAGPWRNP